MRVFLAAGYAMLKQLTEEGRVDGPLDGFAANRRLRDELGELADEELEFALSLAAGEASAAMVGIDGTTRGRRFVLVAEMDDEAVTPDDETPGAIVVRDGIAVGQVDAVLADPDDVTLREGISDDLAWFATQEIDDLLA